MAKAGAETLVAFLRGVNVGGKNKLPMRELVGLLDPAAPDDVRAAAKALGYRDFISIALMIDRKEVFPDNWIYIHDPRVKVGRIQNFKNWSPDMVPDQARTCLGLEYFCFEGDGMWTTPDEGLIEMATRELERLGICKASEVFDGVVVRQQKAYPVYDDVYQDRVAVIREYLARHLPNLHLAGRNGMHKYNNQDHSMYTAMLTVENILGASNDIWAVNVEEEYHEETSAAPAKGGTGRDAPVLPRPVSRA